MLRIALCDDTKLDQKKATDLIYHVFSKNDTQVVCYQSGKELIEQTLSGHFFDIYILDIELPPGDKYKNGVDIAITIHNHIPLAPIIFLTAYSKYAPTGYRSGAIRYIIKTDKNLEQSFSEALQFANQVCAKTNSKHIVFETKDSSFQIPFNDIIFMEKEDRSVYVHTVSHDTIKLSKASIRQIYNQLDPTGFVFIDKSRVVNLHYISKISKDQLFLSVDNIRFLVSRRNRPIIQEKLAESYLLSLEEKSL